MARYRAEARISSGMATSNARTHLAAASARASIDAAWTARQGHYPEESGSHMRHGLDLPVHLDRENERPLLAQLVEQVRAAIHAGAVPSGAQLPSSRVLAAALGISRNLA